MLEKIKNSNIIKTIIIIIKITSNTIKNNCYNNNNKFKHNKNNCNKNNNKDKYDNKFKHNKNNYNDNKNKFKHTGVVRGESHVCL